MNRNDLTDRQREILGFIVRYISRHEYPPTLREMAEELGCTSSRAALSHLGALERKGYIKRKLNVARGIRTIETSKWRRAAGLSPAWEKRKRTRELVTNRQLEFPGRVCGPEGLAYPVCQVLPVCQGPDVRFIQRSVGKYGPCQPRG